MLGILDFFWRLIPANPILLRVVSTGGKRRRDLLIRCAYLGFLIAVVLFSLLSATGSFGTMSLEELAKVSAQLFRTASYWQLGLVTLLAPIFTASAITQEKDSQTYDILLSTPLSNGQIVLGSLLSRLFFVVALLISGVPVFAITQIFGGVAIQSIIYSFAIAAATAFITGAVAVAIAVFKVGTRRTIFAFYLFITIYVAGLWMLDTLEAFHPMLQNGTRSSTGWFTGIHPFLALRVIFNQEQFIPPGILDLPPALQRWPLGWYFSSPHTFYISFTFFLSFVLVTPSIIMMRRLAQSTTTLRSWILQKLHLSTGDKTRKPRSVWSNPIAWREAKTKASAARATVLRYGFMGSGLIGAVYLLWQFSTVLDPGRHIILPACYDAVNNSLTIMGKNEPPYRLARDLSVTLDRNGEKTPKELAGLSGTYRIVGEPGFNRSTNGRMFLASLTLAEPERSITAATARKFLLGMIVIEFAVILLIVTNAAASTVTREKEDGSLDLLLATPITSRYYIWGKLRGLVSFVLPLAAVPVASILIFIIYDIYRSFAGQTGDWIVFPESVLILPGTITIVAAFAAILGMQMSLRCRRTVVAVMGSVGIVMGVCVGMGLCGNLALDSATMGPLGLIVGSFSPFTLMTVLVDPHTWARDAFGIATNDPSSAATARVMVFIFSWAAIGTYVLIVWGMYKSMVKNFDMTIRKQSR